MRKILEKIIDIRLRWILEKTNYLSSQQNGFLKHRSTYNRLHDIQKDIKKTFEARQVLGLVALDIAKAYDTTWRPRIIEKLHKILCHGNMLNFIKHFLSDRTFQIKTDGHLSLTLKQENDVPQGSTISVTLFLIAINDVSESIKLPVNHTFFADDQTIWCRGRNINSIQPILQDTLSSLEK
ncbi:uncharacterized protein LOC112690304 [Sipha flava]|jgi:hypothetical protein|uniref:Uncharacterized protein LOC112690304 n=1 Tax=Sipha flava TaxID=143950 RepID=A0A8B8GA22_9HEMI|nr:uncharacterized protein LOC112690304 [Sipha flava]